MAPLAFRKRYWYAGLVMLLGLGMLILSGWIVYGNQFFPDLADAIHYNGYDNWYYWGHPAKSEMRYMATALEAYYLDHNAYPTMHLLRDYSNDTAILKQAGGWDLSTVEPGRDDILHGLTTPVGYLDSILHGKMPVDIYTSGPKPRFYFRGRYFTAGGQGRLPFAYYQVGQGWLLFSPGPDFDYDIDPAHMYDPTQPVPSAALINVTYDPSNGTTSNGDIWRSKQ